MSARECKYSESEYLQLSGIQHFVFCRRQWALIHIEQQWAENVRTVEGELLHERAHDPNISEKRRGKITVNAMPVFSRSMGISGECDAVEFVADAKGVYLPKYNGKYAVYPVEYKHGTDKYGEEDTLQVIAQAMCLEEMLCCEVNKGYIYYAEKRRRTEVQITDELRQKVRDSFVEMHQYYDRRYTPKVRRTKQCNACSLKNVCLPKLNSKISAVNYIDEMIEGDKP